MSAQSNTKTVVATVGYAFCSSVMLIVNKVAIHYLPAPSVRPILLQWHAEAHMFCPFPNGTPLTLCLPPQVLLFLQLLTSAVTVAVCSGLRRSDPVRRARLGESKALHSRRHCVPWCSVHECEDFAIRKCRDIHRLQKQHASHYFLAGLLVSRERTAEQALVALSHGNHCRRLLICSLR